MATWVGSPNYSQGRNGKPVSIIVVHWIVGDVDAADAVFKNPNSNTSAHYALNASTVHQYVREEDTAWHAGNLDINQRSIGIEHRGGPKTPIDDGTYEQSAQLIADICRRKGLNEGAIHKHNEYFNTACPGTLDINRLKNRVRELLKGEDMASMTTKNDVANLYAQLLGRGASDAEMKDWIGIPWPDAFNGLATSKEGRDFTNFTRDAQKNYKPGSSGSYEPVKEQLYKKK